MKLFWHCFPKVLTERCNTLEAANRRLQADAQVQRQQYERCLDQVAAQVVQAILVQKVGLYEFLLKLILY